MEFAPASSLVVVAFVEEYFNMSLGLAHSEIFGQAVVLPQRVFKEGIVAVENICPFASVEWHDAQMDRDYAPEVRVDTVDLLREGEVGTIVVEQDEIQADSGSLGRVASAYMAAAPSKDHRCLTASPSSQKSGLSMWPARNQAAKRTWTFLMPRSIA